MNRRPRLQVVSLIAFLLAVLTASAAFGAVGGHVVAGSDATVTTCDPSGTDQGGTDEGTTDEATTDEQGNQDEGTCPTDEPTSEPTAEPTDEPSTGGTDTQSGSTATQTPDPQREFECNEAAGLPPTGGAGPGTDTTKLTGLDNAIAHVLANCLTNTNAPGLVTALHHLVHNRDLQAAHQAELAAAKAARDATHAAQAAARGNEHGNSGVAHGNSGVAHGNSAHGPTGS